MDKQLKKQKTTLKLDENYKVFFTEMKYRLKKAQISAALASNQTLINFYWQLGKELVNRQNLFKWGGKTTRTIFS